MRTLFLAAAFCAILPVVASAQIDQPQNLHRSETDGSTEGGWVVQIPSGSSDYFNVRYPAPTGPTTYVGMGAAVYDFGSASTYPVMGLYNQNFGLDPTGFTPDLSSPLTTATSPAVNGGLLNDWQDVAMPAVVVSTEFQCVVQFPPGDPGLLGIGGDTDTSERGGNGAPGLPDPWDASAFTTNGYAAAAAFFGGADWGQNAISNPTPFSGTNGSVGKLRATVDNAQLTGDFTKIRVIAGDQMGVAFFMNEFGGGGSGTSHAFLLFISFLGAPILPVGSPIFVFNDAGSWRYVRAGIAWPTGAGGITVNFVAASGKVGHIGSVGISNEITISSLDDPNNSFGFWDDCSYETGWVVQIPSLTSDYFCVKYGSPAGAISGDLSVAVMDFGGTVTSYPSSGLAPPNLGLDASGLTPNLATPYSSFPFFFPPLTFVTSCINLITNAGPGFDPSGGVNSFIQFPPLDPGLVGVGGDTNSSPNPANNGWTLNGFSTAANQFSVNWGIRTN
jgi:hypothetical protein